MQRICCNETLFFVLTWHESQNSRCLFSPQDFCCSPAFLFVPSLCPALGFPPVYTMSLWPTNKHWRWFSEGREDADQRGRTARVLNNCLRDPAATPTHHTKQTATRTASHITDFKWEKKKCEVEGWSQITAARQSGRQQHLPAQLQKQERQFEGSTVRFLHFYGIIVPF